MKNYALTSLIERTIKFGEELTDYTCNEVDFEKYRKLTFEILQTIQMTNIDQIKLKTCKLIENVKLDDFKLNFWLKLISKPYFNGHFSFWNSNTTEQLRKRYIIRINSLLPILIP